MLLLRAALLLSATPLAAALSTLSRQGVLQGRVSATQAPTGPRHNRDRGWQSNCTAPCTVVDLLEATVTWGCDVPSVRSLGSPEAIVERAEAIRRGEIQPTCPQMAGKVLRARSYIRDGFWVRGQFVLAQATYATMLGIPFIVSLHVNGTCTGPDDPMCDSYEDLSPGVENGDGWEHYFEPVGGVPLSQMNVSEADIVELSQEQTVHLAYAYMIRSDNTTTRGVEPAVNGWAHVAGWLVACPIDPTQSTGLLGVDESCANNTGTDYNLPVPELSAIEQPLPFSSHMYTGVPWQVINMERRWLAPRLAQWMRIQPALLANLEEQWERFVLPAGASPGDEREPIVLGMHVRGTDTNTGTPLPVFFRAVDRYVAAHEACGSGEPCRRVVILLATDDSNFLNSTLARYGRRVATQNGGDIQRSAGGAGVWESAVSDALRLGEEVIMDTMLLSRADFLLRPNSAVSEWAIYNNPSLINNSYTFGSSNPPAPAWMDWTSDDEASALRGNESCVRLAARLSDAYTATDPFMGENSYELGRYLSQHGVLFTMCEKYDNCSARARQGPGGIVAQWSGSWVNERTGFHYFDADPDGRPMGIVLDPRHVTFRCMYPSDGHSHRRDERGCGPYTLDPAYGSRGAGQLRASGQLETARQVMESSMASMTGNLTADQISCVPFYGLGTGGSSPNVTAFHPVDGSMASCERMKRSGRFVVEAATAAWQRMDEAIAGRRVCTPNDATHAMTGQFWVYTGACSWEPTEWQSMVDIFVDHLLPASEDVPDGAEPRHLWNEIIAQPPGDEPAEIAATLAMFYMRTDNATEMEEVRELAATNARQLGNVPVLLIEPRSLASGGPLFTCAMDVEAAEPH